MCMNACSYTKVVHFLSLIEKLVGVRHIIRSCDSYVEWIQYNILCVQSLHYESIR